ncbi:MAG: hypothetical protein ACR2NA_03650 [Solirubrobacterales bacterium]
MKRTFLMVAAVVALVAVPSAAMAVPGKSRGTSEEATSKAQERKDARALKRTSRSEAKRLCRETYKANKAGYRSAFGKRDRRTYGKCISAAMRSELREAKAEAKSDCRALRDSTDAAKKAEYAEFKNFGQCVRSKVKSEMREMRSEIRNAARECKAERRGDDVIEKEDFESDTTKSASENFRAAYGTNANGKNAFGKCVSSKVGEHEDSEPEAPAGS